MSIYVIGVNYKTANIALREKVYFSLDKLALYLQDLLSRGLASEAVLLSTCNRSELYCEADDLQAVCQWFSEQASVPHHELAPALYIHRDEAAVAHMMQVACGLDSMVLGESQILGQLKEAYSESCAAGAVDTLFHRLFQQLFTVAKDIRTTTAIGACPVSVASAAVHFAKLQVPDFAAAKVVLIGAGDTTELLMRYLGGHIAKPITLVNRSVEKAVALAVEFDGQALGLERLGCALSRADVVFSATGSAVPLVTKALVAEVMSMRAGKPLVLIDIAVPRDIEMSVGELEGVNLYCIDDLKAIIEKNMQGREHAAEKIRDMVRIKSKAFMTELHSLDTVKHTIRAYRGQIEEMCYAELIKAKQRLHQGEDPAQVLDWFAHAFTKKLLHNPSVQMRQAGMEQRFDLLRVAKQLFAIPDQEVELI